MLKKLKHIGKIHRLVKWITSITLCSDHIWLQFNFLRVKIVKTRQRFRVGWESSKTRRKLLSKSIGVIR